MQPIVEETRQHAQIFPPAYSAGDTTVYLFTDAVSHISLFTFVSWFSKTSTAVIADICVFRGLIAPGGMQVNTEHYSLWGLSDTW